MIFKLKKKSEIILVNYIKNLVITNGIYPFYSRVTRVHVIQYSRGGLTFLLKGQI